MIPQILAILGIGAAVVGVTVLTVKLANLTVNKIKSLIRERNLRKATVEDIQNGNYNTVDIGLYDDDDTLVEEIHVEADEIGEDICIGDVIYG